MFETQSRLGSVCGRSEPFIEGGRILKNESFKICLGHRAQSGKDTLAKHLIEALGPRPEGTFGPYFPIDIRRYAFADELKIEVFDFLQNLTFYEETFVKA